MLVLELFCCFCKGVLYFVLVGNKGEKLIGFLMFDNLFGVLVG